MAQAAPRWDSEQSTTRVSCPSIKGPYAHARVCFRRKAERGIYPDARAQIIQERARRGRPSIWIDPDLGLATILAR
jgi:hypothetical protein